MGRVQSLQLHKRHVTCILNLGSFANLKAPYRKCTFLLMEVSFSCEVVLNTDDRILLKISSGTESNNTANDSGLQLPGSPSSSKKRVTPNPRP